MQVAQQSYFLQDKGEIRLAERLLALGLDLKWVL